MQMATSLHDVIIRFQPISAIARRQLMQTEHAAELHAEYTIRAAASSRPTNCNQVIARVDTGRQNICTVRPT